MINISGKLFLTLCLSMLLSNSALAAWQLNSQQSQLNFISIKKDAVAEIHSFTSFSGQLADSGVLTFNVDLASVNTQIEIRDQRMQEFLFEVKTFPTASVTGQVDPQWVAKLSPSVPADLNVTLTIDLHGKKLDKVVDLVVVKLGATQIYVSTKTPIVLDAADFGLEAGLKTLQNLAGLPNIAQAVPVTLHLLFTQSKEAK